MLIIAAVMYAHAASDADFAIRRHAFCMPLPSPLCRCHFSRQPAAIFAAAFHAILALLIRQPYARCYADTCHAMSCHHCVVYAGVYAVMMIDALLVAYADAAALPPPLIAAIDFRLLRCRYFEPC